MSRPHKVNRITYQPSFSHLARHSGVHTPTYTHTNHRPVTAARDDTQPTPTQPLTLAHPNTQLAYKWQRQIRKEGKKKTPKNPDVCAGQPRPPPPSSPTCKSSGQESQLQLHPVCLSAFVEPAARGTHWSREGSRSAGWLRGGVADSSVGARGEGGRGKKKSL